ncbi:hypothetical protein BC829DRAFT_284058 [Chytridium lagenaria]|nr:hypothetical protein BC829DRAFT_284058 [Chytridium lagenaria]
MRVFIFFSLFTFTDRKTFSLFSVSYRLILFSFFYIHSYPLFFFVFLKYPSSLKKNPSRKNLRPLFYEAWGQLSLFFFARYLSMFLYFTLLLCWFLPLLINLWFFFFPLPFKI